jgi:hypothetical protein
MYERRRGLSKQTGYALCLYKDLTEIISVILNCSNMKVCYRNTYNSLSADKNFFSTLCNTNGSGRAV